MHKLFILVALLALTGCKSIFGPPLHDGKPAIHPLDEKWKPLEDIRERPKLLQSFGSDTAATVVGEHVYVLDLAEWLGRVPPGSPKYKGVLRHEQEHAIRQFDIGVWRWIARYSYDKEFALREEKIGYYYELTTRQSLGDNVSVDGYAMALSGYENLAGSLISYEESRRWIRDVLLGRWKP